MGRWLFCTLCYTRLVGDVGEMCMEMSSLKCIILQVPPDERCKSPIYLYINSLLPDTASVATKIHRPGNSSAFVSRMTNDPSTSPTSLMPIGEVMHPVPRKSRLPYTDRFDFSNLGVLDGGSRLGCDVMMSLLLFRRRRPQDMFQSSIFTIGYLRCFGIL